LQVAYAIYVKMGQKNYDLFNNAAIFISDLLPD